MLMPGRHYNADKYRYGFQGYEKDDEVNGNIGSHYTTQARAYDSRLGRWWSVDPKFRKQPSWSPYKGFLDNPIIYQDPAGETEYTTIIYTDEKTGHSLKITKVTDQKLMTDGKTHQEYSNGCYTESNAYYDYEIITTVIRHKDGTETRSESKTRIMYENKVKDYDYEWFSGNKNGDTKTDWGGRLEEWRGNNPNGVVFTWNVGQGQETRKGMGPTDIVEIDGLMDLVLGISSAFGNKKAISLVLQSGNKAAQLAQAARFLDWAGDGFAVGQSVVGEYQNQSSKMPFSKKYDLTSEGDTFYYSPSKSHAIVLPNGKDGGDTTFYGIDPKTYPSGWDRVPGRTVPDSEK